MLRARNPRAIARWLLPYWRVLLCLVLTLVVSGILAWALVWRDHEDAVSRATDRTLSISRLIIAHAEAAAAVADGIVSAAVDPVSRWDLQDGEAAKAIAGLLHQAVGENGVVASAAVIDADGNMLVNSRSYPAPPLNVADRPFVKGHKRGLPDPLIMGDAAPGPISGKKRFTFSRAVRKPDGSVHAILSAAIQTENFDILYREVAKWPGAETGLYGRGGDILAQVQQSPRASSSLLQALEKQIGASSNGSGTVFLRSGEVDDLVSWAGSSLYPNLYSATSEPMEDVLRTWRTRTLATVLVVIVGNVLLWALAFAAVSMSRARQAAAIHVLSTREVHHRLKNSLQLISSLIRMRSAGLQDGATKSTVAEILQDIQSVAEVHGQLQNLPPDGTLDLTESLEALCARLRAAYHRDITLQAFGSVRVNASHATGLTIIINELVTNALKHGHGPVEITSSLKNGALVLTVANDGAALPEGFSAGEGAGFGLRAVSAMVRGFSGQLAANSLVHGRVQFSITIPVAELLRS